MEDKYIIGHHTITTLMIPDVLEGLKNSTRFAVPHDSYYYYDTEETLITFTGRVYIFNDIINIRVTNDERRYILRKTKVYNKNFNFL